MPPSVLMLTAGFPGPLLSYPNPPGGGNTLASIVNATLPRHFAAQMQADGVMFVGNWAAVWNIAGMTLSGPIPMVNPVDPLEYFTIHLAITFQGFTRNNPVVAPGGVLDSYLIPSNATLPV